VQSLGVGQPKPAKLSRGYPNQKESGERENRRDWRGPGRYETITFVV
jgi:hypothetical protein